MLQLLREKRFDMLDKCRELAEVLEQSIFTIDRHMASLHTLNRVLEERIQPDSKVLLLQGQSLLSTLSVLRETNYQKLNLIKHCQDIFELEL